MKPVIVSDWVLGEYEDLLLGKNRELKKTTRRKYFSIFSRFLTRNLVPIFLDNNARHEEDLKNISQTCKVKRVDKKDLSIVIFDEHTDMYVFDKCAIDKRKALTGVDIIGKVCLGNWVLELPKQGYSNISLVGVRDFTHQGKSSLYSKYSKDVSFYLGPGFKQEKHFNSEDFKRTDLRSLDDFFYKEDFKPYTFISLDCDVSQDLIGKVDSNHGKRGDLGYKKLMDIMRSVGEKSEIIGLSIFGEGWYFGTFVDAKEEINEVISSFIA